MIREMPINRPENRAVRASLIVARVPMMSRAGEVLTVSRGERNLAGLTGAE